MESSTELQKALYSMLSHGFPVYDALPTDSPMPHYQIGAEQLFEVDTKTEERTRHFVTLHAWSRSNSRTEIYAMNAHIRSNIEDLQVNGHEVDKVTLSFTNVSHETESTGTNLFHSVIQYQIELTQI